MATKHGKALVSVDLGINGCWADRGREKRAEKKRLERYVENMWVKWVKKRTIPRHALGLPRPRPIVLMWIDVFFFCSLAVKFFSRAALDCAPLAFHPHPVERNVWTQDWSSVKGLKRNSSLQNPEVLRDLPTSAGLRLLQKLGNWHSQ